MAGIISEFEVTSFISLTATFFTASLRVSNSSLLIGIEEIQSLLFAASFILVRNLCPLPLDSFIAILIGNESNT
jgi:hypothetical protein